MTSTPRRILVVDDHADIRKLVRMSLEFEPCEVLEAASASVGLATALHWEPDVVLLDVMMPGEYDGLEACRRMRAEPKLAHTRVLLLSARGQSADRSAGIAAGADAYLVKPFSPLELIRAVQSPEVA